MFLALRREFSLSFLLVSHYLLMVRNLADSIAVMKDGAVVEYGSTEIVFGRPRSAYAKEALSSVLAPMDTCKGFKWGRAPAAENETRHYTELSELPVAA